MAGPLSGPAMMMKSMLGFDPSELQTKFDDTMNLLKGTLTHFDNRLASLEKQHAEIVTVLSAFHETIKAQTEIINEQRHLIERIAGKSDDGQPAPDFVNGRISEVDAGTTGNGESDAGTVGGNSETEFADAGTDTGTDAGNDAAPGGERGPADAGSNPGASG